MGAGRHRPGECGVAFLEGLPGPCQYRAGILAALGLSEVGLQALSPSCSAPGTAAEGGMPVMALGKLRAERHTWKAKHGGRAPDGGREQRKEKIEPIATEGSFRS